MSTTVDTTMPEVKPMAEKTEKTEPMPMAAEPVVSMPATEAMPAAEAMPATEATPPADSMPADPMPADAMSKDEAKPEPKARGILSKIMSSFKGAKSPKSPKKEAKKKEEKKEGAEVKGEEAPMATPAPEATTNAEAVVPKSMAEEVPKPMAEEAPKPMAEEVTMVTDSPQATSNPVAAVAAAVTEEVKGVKEAAKEMTAPKASKLSRRISQTVTDIFKHKQKPDAPPSAKVDPLPPMIEQPQSVAPLEHPADKVEEPAEVATPPMAAPAVAATA